MSHANWVQGTEGGTVPLCEECGQAHVRTWADKRFGCGRDRIPAMKVKQHGQGQYMGTLARFPNDPEAYVSGRLDAERLIEKRKRQGWVDKAPPSERSKKRG